MIHSSAVVTAKKFQTSNKKRTTFFFSFPIEKLFTKGWTSLIFPVPNNDITNIFMIYVSSNASILIFWHLEMTSTCRTCIILTISMIQAFVSRHDLLAFEHDAFFFACTFSSNHQDLISASSAKLCITLKKTRKTTVLLFGAP